MNKVHKNTIQMAEFKIIIMFHDATVTHIKLNMCP